MIKKGIGILLIIAALVCIVWTVYEFAMEKGQITILSNDIIGAALFHGICMMIAMYLLSGPGIKKEKRKKEV